MKISKHRQRGRSQRGPASRRSSFAKASSGSSDSDSSGSSDSDPDPDLSGTEPDQAKTQEIRCTTEHPFWVVGRGWVPAGELRDGDELVGEHEESLFVESARIDKEDDHYNFEVEDWHSYFVGEDGNGLGPAVWVHNDCDPIHVALGIDKLSKEKILARYKPTDIEYRDGVKLLEPFADAVGAVDNSRWATIGIDPYRDFHVRFEEALDLAHSSGGRIKFNLDEVSLSRLWEVNVTNVIDPIGSVPSVTIWELQQVLTRRKLYDITEFYIGRERIVGQDLIDFGLQFGHPR